MLIHIMLEQTVYRGLYNDVSMLLDGKIIVLVEQQSTVNEKLIRALNAQKNAEIQYLKEEIERLKSKKSKKIVYTFSFAKFIFFPHFTNFCKYSALLQNILPDFRKQSAVFQPKALGLRFSALLSKPDSALFLPMAERTKCV